jgi:hypothetical protein
MFPMPDKMRSRSHRYHKTARETTATAVISPSFVKAYRAYMGAEA